MAAPALRKSSQESRLKIIICPGQKKKKGKFLRACNRRTIPAGETALGKAFLEKTPGRGEKIEKSRGESCKVQKRKKHHGR